MDKDASLASRSLYIFQQGERMPGGCSSAKLLSRISAPLQSYYHAFSPLQSYYHVLAPSQSYNQLFSRTRISTSARSSTTTQGSSRNRKMWNQKNVELCENYELSGTIYLVWSDQVKQNSGRPTQILCLCRAAPKFRFCNILCCT